MIGLIAGFDDGVAQKAHLLECIDIVAAHRLQMGVGDHGAVSQGEPPEPPCQLCRAIVGVHVTGIEPPGLFVGFQSLFRFRQTLPDLAQQVRGCRRHWLKASRLRQMFDGIVVSVALQIQPPQSSLHDSIFGRQCDGMQQRALRLVIAPQVRIETPEVGVVGGLIRLQGNGSLQVADGLSVLTLARVQTRRHTLQPRILRKKFHGASQRAGRFGRPPGHEQRPGQSTTHLDRHRQAVGTS